METKYCPCGYPILLDERWNGLAHVLVFRDGRTGAEISECPGCGESETAWLWIPPGCENLHLKPGALLDEAPKTWIWWTPTDEVVCDLCNKLIKARPVPLLWDGYAVCADCFKKTSGISLEEAA